MREVELLAEFAGGGEGMGARKGHQARALIGLGKEVKVGFPYVIQTARNTTPIHTAHYSVPPMDTGTNR